MKTTNVPSGWIKSEGARLDVGPFVSGAVETKVTLESLPVRKDLLHTLTKGFDGGIFNGPHFGRNYVKYPEKGVPFVGSASMLMADISGLPLLGKEDATSDKLRHLKLTEGTTLISCSGTIGRMVYVRPELQGVWSSQHIMKVVPDKSCIKPGYLYAFLSSRFGVSLVIAGTYGAIIQHIEPRHIADLPIPRLGDSVEKEVDAYVREAGAARTRATVLLEDAQQRLRKVLRVSQLRPAYTYSAPQCTAVSSETISGRLNAFYYCSMNAEARDDLDKAIDVHGSRRLAEVANVFIPNIFKRLYADDPDYGYPYITGADAFQLAPTSDRNLLRRVAEDVGLVLKKGMIAIQEAGQLGGIIGRSVLVGEYLDGFACTNNMVRICPNSTADTGYLFALLSSEHGVRMLKREAAGTSIPHIDEKRVASIAIPWPDAQARKEIGVPVMEAQRLRDEACAMEDEARRMVEEEIERLGRGGGERG